MQKLTEDQFEAANNEVIARIQAAKRGSPERDAARAQADRWDDAYALPDATWEQRKTRHVAIAACAIALGLVKP